MKTKANDPHNHSDETHCVHGVYTGTWCGPDYMCGLCEDGFTSKCPVCKRFTFISRFTSWRRSSRRDSAIPLSEDSGKAGSFRRKRHSMGMHASTAYNHTKRLLGRMQSHIADTRSFKLTHEKMLSDYSVKVLDDPAWKRIPQASREYISGYRDALIASIWRHDVEWRLFYRGKYVTSKDIPNGEWHRVDVEAGCHFWVGTDKPWSKDQVAQGPPAPEMW